MATDRLVSPDPDAHRPGGADAHEQQIVRTLRARAGTFMSTPDDAEGMAAELREVHDEFARFRLYYQFGIEEVLTKINILRQEFEQSHAYSPIEHVRSRLKSVESLLEKVVRVECDLAIPAIRDRVRDIAGIRITCSFVSDVYAIAGMLARQPDLTVVQTKDYIENPKDNGYQSLHLIVQVPVFLSDHTENVFVELQIRTIAMDFWASIEHKLSYKYRNELPRHLVAELDAAARSAADLDARMGRLRDEILTLGAESEAGPGIGAPAPRRERET